MDKTSACGADDQGSIPCGDIFCLQKMSTSEQIVLLASGIEDRSDARVCPKDKASAARGGLRKISVRKFICRRFLAGTLLRSTNFAVQAFCI